MMLCDVTEYIHTRIHTHTHTHTHTKEIISRNLLRILKKCFLVTGCSHLGRQKMTFYFSMTITRLQGLMDYKLVTFSACIYHWSRVNPLYTVDMTTSILSIVYVELFMMTPPVTRKKEVFWIFLSKSLIFLPETRCVVKSAWGFKSLTTL